MRSEQQQQPQPSAAAQVKGAFNLLGVAADVLAFPINLFTTRWGTWGPRFLASPAVLGVFWPPLFMALCGPAPGVRAVVPFWWATLAALVVHQVRAAGRRRAGHRPHSRYWGDSRLQRGGGLADQRRAREWTALLAVAVGVAVAAVAKPLGVLIVIGGGAKLVSDAMAFAAATARLRQMEDARIENDWYLAAYRERTGAE